MNILVVPSWYLSKNSPNKGSFFREQALALQKAGHNVTILNGTFLSRKDYLDTNNFRLRITDDEGMKVYSYVTPSFGIDRYKKILNFVFYSRLEKMYKKVVSDGISIDIIHAHSFSPAGYSACKLGEKFNIPVVVTEHASRVLNKDLSLYEIECLTDCVRNSTSFICVSDALKGSVKELVGIKKSIEVIPNMVSDIFSYKKVNKKNKDNFIFFTLGNLVHGKRFDLTINAFTEAFKGNRSVELYIGGAGPLYNSLLKLIEINDMEGQIKLLGGLSRKEVLRIMQECDVFVLASDYETFGVVYIEALACGKPIIGTKNGGAEKIINESNGVLVDKNNLDQLKGALQKSYYKIDSFDSNSIMSSCIKNYGEKRFVEKILEVYRAAIVS